ncbi:unnamed protein product, partial [Prorocentrum cordatum]
SPILGDADSEATCWSVAVDSDAGGSGAFGPDAFALGVLEALAETGVLGDLLQESPRPLRAATRRLPSPPRPRGPRTPPPRGRHQRRGAPGGAPGQGRPWPRAVAGRLRAGRAGAGRAAGCPGRRRGGRGARRRPGGGRWPPGVVEGGSQGRAGERAVHGRGPGGRRAGRGRRARRGRAGRGHPRGPWRGRLRVRVPGRVPERRGDRRR